MGLNAEKLIGALGNLSSDQGLGSFGEGPNEPRITNIPKRNQQNYRVSIAGKPSAFGTDHPVDVALGHARRFQSFKESSSGNAAGDALQGAAELQKSGSMASSRPTEMI